MDEAVVAILMCCCLLGWLRVYRKPGVRFGQAEVIVIGKIVPDSIQLYPSVGGAEDFGAVLRVTLVLKGQPTGQEVPIVLHHGLTPVVGGYLKTARTTIDAGQRQAGVIELWDTGDSAVSCEPFVADAREDHIWCLSRHPDYWPYSGCGPPAHASQLGVTEPDEVLAIDKTVLDRLLHEDDQAIVFAVVNRIVVHITRQSAHGADEAVG
jgi:hypothetical protein